DQIAVVPETPNELGAADEPTLLVFNKVDNVEEPVIINAARQQYENAAFVSALRGIGLIDLETKLLSVIERDFVERIVYVPVSEGKTISYIHRGADGISEGDMYARNGAPEDEPTAVARLRFRCSCK